MEALADSRKNVMCDVLLMVENTRNDRTIVQLKFFMIEPSFILQDHHWTRAPLLDHKSRIVPPSFFRGLRNWRELKIWTFCVPS
jgi:hypothetical protein